MWVSIALIIIVHSVCKNGIEMNNATRTSLEYIEIKN